MYIQIPVKTEVIAKNEDICTQGRFEDGKIVIAMDARRRDYKSYGMYHGGSAFAG